MKFGLLLSPVIAAAAMSLNSVSAITNALRLERVKLQKRRRVPSNTTYNLGRSTERPA